MPAPQNHWIEVAEFSHEGARAVTATHGLDGLATRFGRAARRFETADQEFRAVLVPTAIVASAAVDPGTGKAVVTGLPHDCPETIFLTRNSGPEHQSPWSPPFAELASGGSGLVAVPEGNQLPDGLADSESLGLLVFAAESEMQQRFHLYRVGRQAESRRPLAKPSGMKPGEATGNLQARSKWFQGREGESSSS